MPPITIYCPVTRLEYMDRWFDDLASTDLDPGLVNLVFIIDTDEPKIYARIMQEMNRTTFRRFLIKRNYDHRVNEVNIPIRRQRIAELHSQAVPMVADTDGEFVLGLEDDTVFTNLNVYRMYHQFFNDEATGLVSAYEAGRWHAKILGVWNFDDYENPKECWTMLPGKDFESIDACGWYCYLTRRASFLLHDANTEVWQPWGPDVNFGLELKRKGLNNYVDWTQSCGHRDGNLIITPNSDLYVEHFWEVNTNEWVRRKQD